MAEESTLRKHCRTYLKAFRAQRRRNLHAYYAHRFADSETDRKFHLTPDERKRRNEWLDSKVEFEGWNKEPEPDRGQSLFDEVMRAE